ncbi:NAD(P)/FAD-dependent oxidoreductase [Halococcus thailandensis]|uniref:Electron-transferring-flavoprotein dehydrogenase n=1 Tax=Halococcus thailandensis JCM 13552 TaxID=1227457 RepID=M0MYJ1_9EURY|nr:NAD(P)/FAD-dependent oxidoreductase [Halococcus thailandensis]EMA50383.1 electron-transferring-flavoprotein dehydrogenase [Halococcus thailandensis JCM 13552]
MERIDVAVVGGGPAGSSAGRAAARQDAETVVLEKGVPREDRAELGPDSTDAAGMLDYWVDLMDLPEAIPDDVILRELNGATFAGPTERLTIRETGMGSSYPDFGFTFHRARFDDWLRERCEAAGADYRVGTSVRDVAIDRRGTHTLTLRDGTEIETDYLILADGPQRTVTRGVLGEFVAERRLEDLASNRANHIAYQEYREFPPELFDEDLLKFWWGSMPGHTAYPWVFPNDGCVARVGLTMPIGLDIDEVRNPERYRLLEPDDETVPSGKEYVERLLAAEYPDYGLDDFPLVEDRGKSGGTETYPISSTRPIDSPTGANVAIVGGAMGATSAFHEGGDHVAVRTGKIAGSLAGAGALDTYNREWKRAVGDEILRNVSMADVVTGFEPDDWDDAFRSVDRMLDDGRLSALRMPFSGRAGLSVLARYGKAKFGYRNGGYVQLRESEYAV